MRLALYSSHESQVFQAETCGTRGITKMEAKAASSETFCGNIHIVEILVFFPLYTIRNVTRLSWTTTTSLVLRATPFEA